MSRTDQHRKGAIIPNRYEHVLFYNLATSDDGWPIPSFKVNCGEGKHRHDGNCCIVGLRQIAKVKFASHGTTGKCTVCGSSFIYGEVWKHIPTGEHIHVGHVCAHKYGLMSDMTDHEIEYEKFKHDVINKAKREQNKKDREEFLSNHPGLEEALKTEHNIVKNINDFFMTRCILSEKQIALVFKLSKEAKESNIEEKHVPAPTGKQTFTGVVVGTKIQESRYGSTLKMIVKVEEQNGTWLAYGSVPSNLKMSSEGLKDKKVEITATLTQSKDSHFAFFKNPKGHFVS